MISRRRLATAATIIMVGSVVSRALGIVREQVIAALFGPTATTSAFVAASTVPTMVYDLLIGGAVSAALVPVFSEYVASGHAGSKARQQADDDLAQAAGSVLTLALVLLVALSALLIVLAPQLIWLLAAGLDPAVQAQSVGLVRLMLPGVVFLGLSGVTTALLYSRQAFRYPALALGVYNAGIIAGAALFAGAIGINSLAVGVLAGAIAQLALQWLGIRDLRMRFAIDFKHPAVRRILRLYAPVAFGLVISQIGVVIDRNLASRTGEDSLAVMRFATTLVQFPLGLTAAALSFAILPSLARLDALRDHAAYKSSLAIGLRLIVLTVLPITVGLLLVRIPLIQVVFEHGVFDAQGTARTALAFLAYAPQIPFAAADQLLIFAFYARKNTVTPMLVGVLGVLVYLVAGVSFIGPLGWGMPGLALANTLQNSLHAVVLYLLLRRSIGSLRGHGLGGTLARSSAACAIMLAVWLLAQPAILGWLQVDELTARVAYLGLAVVIGGGVYLAALAAFKTEEVVSVWIMIKRRTRRTSV